MENLENYYGRQLLKVDVENQKILRKLTRYPGMTELSSQKIKCNRCHTEHEKTEVSLELSESFYCPSCIQLGRVRSDEWLYHLPQKHFLGHDYLCWTGHLTDAQEKISRELNLQLTHTSRVMILAVTGAGKTEMIYAALNAALKSGKVVALASPRIDVCIELHKRLSRDFSCTIPLLFGGGAPYFRAPLIITTTMQLLRFKSAFDFLVIDEVDAFPFSENPQLYFAAENACQKEAKILYLTATSSPMLERQVKKKQLVKLELAKRFHENPLVVPKTFWHHQWLKKIQQQRKTGFPLLIFAPKIDSGRQWTKQLQEKFPLEKIEFVASTSENRHDLISQFHLGRIDILVSTTILERGVTFPKVDVFVLNTSHPNFTTSSLIQMAGRVGRSPERPYGLVYFFHDGKSDAMIAAIKEIKRQNQLGSKQ